MNLLNGTLFQDLFSKAKQHHQQHQQQWQFTHAMQAFSKILVDPVDSLDAVTDLGDSLVRSRAYDLATDYMKSDPDNAAMIQSRYLARSHDLEALLCYPSNSLGHIYASTMLQNGFKPFFYWHPIESDNRYIEMRLDQTHDIWHIITGFGTSPVDEIGLQTVYLAQGRHPLAAMLVANGLVGDTLLNPEELPQMLTAIARGWNMGINAKSLLAQKWEEGWEKSLEEWRSDLGIEVVG
ncbi:MAG: Coq4 family protein [Oculatellaceae cyanobacterium Prado106]|nr:Coq4 family protein [Oculatellaceae cyanobacterium Prado106]